MSLALKGLQDIKWKVVDLPDIVFFQEGPGVRKTQYTQDGVKLLNVANLQKGKVDLTTSDRYISKEEAYGRYEHFLVDEGDLIIASSGIQISYFEEKMGFITEEHLPLCMNTSTIRFKSLDEEVLNIRYFMYFLKTNFFKKQIQRLITGSAQLNFGPSHLKQIKVILPEIAIQDQIVELLDTTQNMIDKRQQQIEALSALKQSVFFDMFGDPRLNDKEWSTATIKQLSEEITQINPKKLDEKINYLDISSINNRNNEINQVHQYHSSKAPSRARQKVKQGDILISTVRPNLKNIARIELAGEYIASSGFCVIRTKEVDQLFLYELIKLDYFTEELTKLTTGANYPAIKKSDVLNQKIILPSIELQNKFGQRIKVINEQINLLTKSLEQINLLYDSILYKAFNGELFKDNMKV